MEDAEVLELFELEHSDLILLSADEDMSSSSDYIERHRSISKRIMENLGPAGPGLIAIKSVPGASQLRQSLLPLARKLALLHNDDRKRILKEHSLGSDVPLKNLDRIVSSFAMQLKYDKLGLDCDEDQETLSMGDLDAEFKDLGHSFKKLGFLMMQLGLSLARICDRAIGGRELEGSLLESCSAKGRLIHYHSTTDNAIIKEAAKRKGQITNRLQTNGRNNEKQSEYKKQYVDNQGVFWQQWHYDYGVFTVLTAPMFTLSCDRECPPPNSHTYLQVYHPERERVFVDASPESFIVQVGESADVLSKGKLRATLHCVRRPSSLENLGRETFVVFLQPSWNKTFSLTNYPVQDSNWYHVGASTEQGYAGQQDFNKSFPAIHSVVPPLSLRMRDGMTFAEFSKETTKQYYGGTGLQSKR